MARRYVRPLMADPPWFGGGYSGEAEFEAAEMRAEQDAANADVAEYHHLRERDACDCGHERRDHHRQVGHGLRSPADGCSLCPCDRFFVREGGSV